MIHFFSRNLNKVSTAAINLCPRKGSWGGANQWTAQLSRWLQYHGWVVNYDLKKNPDVIIMTHTGLSAGTSFGSAEVAAFKKQYPRVRCLHRSNYNDLRKESSEMDHFLAESTRVADHTVFVSKWLRDHHASRWFDPSRPHSIVTPGADLRFFNPIGTSLPAPGEPLRLVTHHWSDNWNKGFDVYQQIDEFIASQSSRQFELWVIGRWPKEIEWKSARTFAPASGGALASLLRQCGLPLLYHRDTGGTVEQGLRYGMEIGKDLSETLNRFAQELPMLRSKLLSDPPSGSKMSLEYLQLLQRLIVS